MKKCEHCGQKIHEYSDNMYEVFKSAFLIFGGAFTICGIIMYIIVWSMSIDSFLPMLLVIPMTAIVIYATEKLKD